MRHRGLSALSQAHRHFPARRGDARSAPTAIADAECRARTPTHAATTPATGAGLPRPAAATAGERAHADGVGDCPRGLRAVALKRAAYTNRASKVHYLPPSLRFPPLREGNRERRAYSVPPACRGNLKEGVLVYPYFCELWLSDWYQTTHRRFRMMRRQKVLGVVALSLAVTNLIALPDTLNAVAALRGGGQR